MRPDDGQPTPTDPALRRQLEEAAEGLVYSSEGDYPFEFISLGPVETEGPLTPARFAALLGAPAGVRVGEVSLDHFLANHIEASDPWDTQAQRIRPCYERLKALLQTSLSDVRVFRIGEIQVRCYIVGRDRHGSLAGLRTTAIET